MLKLGQRLQRARLLMVLCCAVLVICQAGPVTHRCNLHVDGAQKTLNLSCQYQQQGAPSKCKLVVYYNSTVPSLRIVKPFGIPMYALPKLPSAPLRSAEVNATEMKLNRTEPIYNSIMWPLLYFHGGPSCHVWFESPVIREVELPKQSGEASQVLVFGGGLTATLIGGEITKNTAVMGVTVLAGSTLRASHTRCTLNNLSRGCFYGSYTSQLFLDSVTLSSNRADEGAGLYLVNSRATVTYSNLSHNVATAGGGAAYVKGNSSIFLTKCHLLGNAAPTGGALTVYNAPLVRIHSCKFEGNYAHSDDVDLSTDNYYQLGVGGALYLEYSVVYVISSTLEGNKAVMDGGAMRLQTAQLTISHSNIINNLAYRHGGGIYAGAVDTDADKNSTLGIDQSALWDNTAQANGGGIMINRWCHTTIINSSFKGCKAWSEGDGVCTILGGQDTAHLQDDLRTQLTINNVTFLADEETDEKLFVGPFFNLTFENTDLNQSSVGVVWRRRLCHKGEYVALSGYCEECPSYTFSTVEKFPGHTSRGCEPAPRNAYAPGGAVLVPFSGGWHGVDGSVRICSGCPPFVAKLEEIKRCPNPGACVHSTEDLAWRHPDSHNSSRLSDMQYGNALCDARNGYTGILCGTCIQGFGTPAPFSCVQCLGARVIFDNLGGFEVQQPKPGGISGLYFAYMFALTCGLLLCVRFSVPTILVDLSKSQPVQGAAAAAALLPPPGAVAAAEVTSTEPGALEAAQNAQRQQDMVGRHQQQQHSQRAPSREGSRDSHRPLHSKAIDVTKALITYIQWAVLILNLPPSWLPWSSGSVLQSIQPKTNPTGGAASTTRSPLGAASRLFGVLSGRSASLDCFLQAWGMLQGDSLHQLVNNVFARAVGSAIVVPCILFLSVLLLQMLLRMLRLPTLRLLVKLCGKSHFFSRHVGRWFGLNDLQLDARMSSAAPPGSSTVEAGGKHLPRESSDTFRATSASSLSSAQSVASSSSLLSLGMLPGVAAGGARKMLVDDVVATVMAISLTLYPTIAKTAIGMLLCVRIGSDADPPAAPLRWILDVRLQCPTAPPITPWGVAAIVLGVLLLSVCVGWSVGIAAVLIWEARRGNLLRLGAAGATAAAASTAAHTTARLAMRYADYDVDYEALITGTSESLPTARNTNTTSCWKSFRSCVGPVLLRMQKYAVLVWDSILDLHKLTLVSVSLCVMLHELHQLALMIMVLGSYLVLVLLVKPWRSRAVWRLQVSSLLLLLTSCMGIGACTVADALTYYANKSYESYMRVIPWLIVAANLCYLAFVVCCLLRCAWRELPRLADLQKYIHSLQSKMRRRVQRHRGGR